jgi:hypothetical protein
VGFYLALFAAFAVGTAFGVIIMTFMRNAD